MNTLGQPYRLAFDFGPATYTAAANNSNANFSAGQIATLNYTGDGNGSIRIRLSCINNADNRFGGGLDNLTLQALIGTVIRIR